MPSYQTKTGLEAQVAKSNLVDIDIDEIALVDKASLPVHPGAVIDFVKAKTIIPVAKADDGITEDDKNMTKFLKGLKTLFAIGSDSLEVEKSSAKGATGDKKMLDADGDYDAEKDEADFKAGKKGDDDSDDDGKDGKTKAKKSFEDMSEEEILAGLLEKAKAKAKKVSTTEADEKEVESETGEEENENGMKKSGFNPTTEVLRTTNTSVTAPGAANALSISLEGDVAQTDMQKALLSITSAIDGIQAQLNEFNKANAGAAIPAEVRGHSTTATKEATKFVQAAKGTIMDSLHAPSAEGAALDKESAQDGPMVADHRHVADGVHDGATDTDFHPYGGGDGMKKSATQTNEDLMKSFETMLASYLAPLSTKIDEAATLAKSTKDAQDDLTVNFDRKVANHIKTVLAKADDVLITQARKNELHPMPTSVANVSKAPEKDVKEVIKNMTLSKAISTLLHTEDNIAAYNNGDFS